MKNQGLNIIPVFSSCFLPVYQNSSTKNTKIVLNWDTTFFTWHGCIPCLHVCFESLLNPSSLSTRAFCKFYWRCWRTLWDLRGDFGRYVGCPFREYNQLWWILEAGCWKMRQGVWGTLCQPPPLSTSKSVTWCFMLRGECDSANTKGKIFLWGV